MNVKIEDLSSRKIKNLERQVKVILSAVPVEHLRGFAKLVFVDRIHEPRLASSLPQEDLPALYHPRMGGQMAWGEVATSVILPKKKFPQNLMARLALKPNLAQVVLSLIAQHYYLTISKGIKKTQLEYAVRSYTEKHFERWREKQGGLRMKLLKPFRPHLDRLARKLSKKYREELEKSRRQR
jgi:hypothetical protein